MEFVNNTPSPALNFEGVDSQQAFHVIVMRQTYIWDETGLLALAREQDPLCMMDETVHSDDVMSGVIQESDLCHYKPKCDILISGNAYAPQGKRSNSFVASVKVQTPDKVIFADTTTSSKYQFQERQSKQPKPTISQRIKGDLLIDKKLIVTGERYIESIDESITGSYHLFSGVSRQVNKVSLNPNSSLGGCCVLDDEHPNLEKIDTKQLIPESDRAAMPIKEHTAPIAYFSQYAGNPYGTGYLTSEYIRAMTTAQLIAKQIALPQIHYPQHVITDSTLNKVLNGKLDDTESSQMVAGFGIRAKSHPERYKYLGAIDDAYLARIKGATEAQQIVPEGFDFAIWNCAYPDQQTEHLKGNEWITLTNLCDVETPAATIMANGDTTLTLYLPESFATLMTKSSIEDYPDAEVPMKLDTISIHPDEHKVNLIWRGIIAASYEPEVILLEYVSPEKHRQILKQYFTQKGDIVRPHTGEEP